MRLPFLQIDADFVAHKSRDVAAVLGCSRVQAVGHLSMLWAWALSRGPEDAAPDGVIIGPRAAQLLESGAEWLGERGAFVNALSDPSVGLIEQVDGGYRVRGMDRYRKAWDRQRKDRDRKADVRRTSSGQAQDGVRQTQIQTQIQKEEDPPNPPGGDPSPPDDKGYIPPRNIVSPPSEPHPFEAAAPPEESLQDGINRVNREALGSDYPWDDARDIPASKRCLVLANGAGVPEVLKRYGHGVRAQFAQRVSSLTELARKWNANAKPEASGQGPPATQKRDLNPNDYREGRVERL